MGESPRTEPSMTHAVLVLGLAGLDATWRTIVPGVVGTVLGLMADNALHTTPLITIIGLVLGIALSVLLVYRLLKGVKK